MTIVTKKFANFDQNFDVINNVIILLRIKDTFFDSILAQQLLQMSTKEKFGKIVTLGLVQTYLVAIPIQDVSPC